MGYRESAGQSALKPAAGNDSLLMPLSSCLVYDG